MAAPRCFALFTTAVGECAVAWHDEGLIGIWLPEKRRGALRAKLARRLPGAVECTAPAEVAAAIAAIRQVLAGARVDLSDIRLDLARVDEFERRVYVVTRTIEPGRVLTYRALAQRVGTDATARAVGHALGENPFPIVVPCHRVIATNGGLGGFSAPGGVTLKRRLLAIEDARPEGPPGLFDAPADADADTDTRVPRP